MKGSIGWRSQDSNTRSELRARSLSPMGGADPELPVTDETSGLPAILRVMRNLGMDSKPLAKLEQFGPSLYVADGPTVSFAGFPYPTRMAAARLSDGSVWVW